MSEAFKLQRSRDDVPGDLVIGKFLGDSDLLVVRCAPDSPDFGHVMVALPIDLRKDWYRVAGNLERFFQEDERSERAKFWEDG